MALFGRESQADQERAAAYAQWLGQRNPCAIASLVLGVFSFIEMGALIVFGVGGIVLGTVALRQLKAPTNRPLGHRLAWWGISLSAASLLIATGMYLYPVVKQ